MTYLQCRTHHLSLVEFQNKIQGLSMALPFQNYVNNFVIHSGVLIRSLHLCTDCVLAVLARVRHRAYSSHGGEAHMTSGVGSLQ